MPPLGIWSREHRSEAALRAVEARAVIDPVEYAAAEREVRVEPGVELQLLQRRADEADVQSSHAGELVRVGAVEVEAPGLKAADVHRLEGDERVTRPQ